MQRKKKRKGSGRGEPNTHTHTHTHARKQNQLWCWTFSVSHEATWSIWRRFLKTFRREGEFSAEKLNLPYSSGPIWDLSLLTAPQGTAVIFRTACTPRNTLLNQRMSARARAQLTAPGAERLVNSTPPPPAPFLPTDRALAPRVSLAHSLKAEKRQRLMSLLSEDHKRKRVIL